ncbi:MAG: NAD(P)-binding domain-containing protein, partial [Actinomycetota bacterium]|nr:NAD(P)-binding domain-containing protein [Actinomycetota bacterium]
METLGILGGTGPQGRGLGLRFAQAGHPVLIGSRDAGRAEQAAAELRARVGAVEVRGVVNADCSRAEVVVVAVPYEAQA